MRSPFLVLGFALGASLLPACSAADGGSDLGTTSAAASAGTSATQALNDMLDTFWDEPAGELRSSATSYWINAQAMDAVLDGVERSHGTEFSKWVPKIIDGNEKEFGGWFTASYGETFFDDITWMTLALIRASDLSTGWDRAKYLGTARTVFQRVMDEAPSHDGGAFAGLWWSSKHDHDEKATASNFGPVIAAARLYERTNDATYKTFAATVYDYWHAHMIDTMPDGSDFVIDSTQNGEGAAEVHLQPGARHPGGALHARHRNRGEPQGHALRRSRRDGRLPHAPRDEERRPPRLRQRRQDPIRMHGRLCCLQGDRLSLPRQAL
jgi:hypothetical protein